MDYCDSGDLKNYLTENFYNIKWLNKLNILKEIIGGLKHIHGKRITHRDLHSGNILCSKNNRSLMVSISDLGLSKSSTESTNDKSDEIYGIIPYIAPEIFQGQDYTAASDIYSFGIIMWEIMTGRRAFWNQNHDTELIIEICDGLRPPIITNAPEDYIELMQKCWHSDPDKRPTASEIYIRGLTLIINRERRSTTNIIKSPDIGPITMN